MPDKTYDGCTPTDLDRLSLWFFLRLTQKIHSHLSNHVAITPDVDGKDTIAAKPAHDYAEPSMTSTIVKLGYAPMLLASKQSKEGLPILGRMFVSIGSGEVARIADDDHASVNAKFGQRIPKTSSAVDAITSSTSVALSLPPSPQPHSVLRSSPNDRLHGHLSSQ
jgi:hypothetical protein